MTIPGNSSMDDRLESAHEEIKEILEKYKVRFHVGINKELMLIPGDHLGEMFTKDVWVELDNVIVS